MKKLKIILIIFSILLIIVGFGTIHGKSRTRELGGSISIGIGTTYLLFLLFKSTKQNRNEE